MERRIILYRGVKKLFSLWFYLSFSVDIEENEHIVDITVPVLPVSYCRDESKLPVNSQKSLIPAPPCLTGSSAVEAGPVYTVAFVL